MSLSGSWFHAFSPFWYLVVHAFATSIRDSTVRTLTQLCTASKGNPCGALRDLWAVKSRVFLVAPNTRTEVQLL